MTSRPIKRTGESEAYRACNAVFPRNWRGECGVLSGWGGERCGRYDFGILVMIDVDRRVCDGLGVG